MEENMEELEIQGVAWEKRREIGVFRAFVETIRAVFLHPSDFFADLSKKDSYKDAFIFYIAVNAVLSGILVLFMFFTGALSFLAAWLNYSWGAGVFLVLIMAFIVISGIFISAFIMDLFVLAFRGKGKFSSTFNVVAYGTAVDLIFFPLFLIVLFLNMLLFRSRILPPLVTLIVTKIFFYSVFLTAFVWITSVLVSGVRKLHDLALGRALLAVLIPVVLIGSLNLAANKSLRRPYRRSLSHSSLDADEALARNNIQSIKIGCQTYFSENGEYPFSLEELAGNYIPYEVAGAVSPETAFKGYFYEYQLADKEHFYLYAVYAGSEDENRRVLFLDQAGVLRFDGPEGAIVGREEDAGRDE